MSIKHLIYLISLLFIFGSCNNTGKNIGEILRKAGKNRQELEKVIQHYKKIKDKEKLKAAYFLIGNMENKYGRYGDFIKNYYPVFNRLHELNNKKIDKDIINKNITAMWDSIEKIVGPVTSENCQVYNDYFVVTADFLIDNIDMSFKAWKEKPWAKNVSFDQFCELILPYRVYDEPLQYFKEKYYKEFSWLEDSLKDKSNPLEACRILNNYLAKNFAFCSKLDRFPQAGVNDMYKLNGGTCEHRYLIIASIMRSVGLPVGIDFTPQWNAWPGNHSWLYILDPNGKVRAFNGGEPDIKFPDTLKVPMGTTGKTSKVYRKTFAINPTLIQKNVPIQNIPDFFKKSDFFEVTNDYKYTQTSLNFDLKIVPPDGIKYAFLCCFGFSYSIVPISYAKISGNSAKFNNAGIMGGYFPAYYSDNRYIIANNPYYYDDNGNLTVLNPDKSKLISVKLTRKFPPQIELNGKFVEWMKGAKLQAADNTAFTNPVTLFTIDSSYYYYAEINITMDKPYRYYRYLSSDTGKVRIAEVDFVIKGMENIPAKNKKFTIFGHCTKDSVNSKCELANAFDGNIATNYNAPPGSWAAIDYGKPVNVSKVRFLVRNDLNIIETGDEYELLYFDYGWQSLGRKKADKNYIEFNNVPDNAALLLRDVTKGQEERVFMYRNNQQVWF